MSENLVLNFPVAASANIRVGEPVIISSGYATQATTTGATCMGVAATDCDNSSGSAGDKYVGIVFSGVKQCPTYVGDTDAAGLYSSAISIGDELCVGVIADRPYLVKNNFASTTSIVVGFALAANAGSTSAATVATCSVVICGTKCDGAALE